MEASTLSHPRAPALLMLLHLIGASLHHCIYLIALPLVSRHLVKNSYASNRGFFEARQRCSHTGFEMCSAAAFWVSLRCGWCARTASRLSIWSASVGGFSPDYKTLGQCSCLAVSSRLIDPRRRPLLSLSPPLSPTPGQSSLSVFSPQKGCCVRSTINLSTIDRSLLPPRTNGKQ